MLVFVSCSRWLASAQARYGYTATSSDGCTPLPHVLLVVHNTVPNSGSNTIGAVIHAAAQAHGFQVEVSRDYSATQLDTAAQQRRELRVPRLITTMYPHPRLRLRHALGTESRPVGWRLTRLSTPRHRLVDGPLLNRSVRRGRKLVYVQHTSTRELRDDHLGGTCSPCCDM